MTPDAAAADNELPADPSSSPMTPTAEPIAASVVPPPAEIPLAPVIERPAAVVVPVIPPAAPTERATGPLTTTLPNSAIVTEDRPRRLAALDVFRGITIAMMVLVNNSGGPEKDTYGMLNHVDWHGWTPTDLVFPFFLFIVGVATPFSLAKRSALATGRGELVARIWIRALSLIVLGHLLSATNIPWPFRDVPHDGFFFTKLMRTVGFFGSWAAIFLILAPWKSNGSAPGFLSASPP